MGRLYLVALFVSYFLLQISIDGFSQMSIANKLWVGQNSEYLLADSTIIRFETFTEKFGNTRVARFYSISGDTLKIVEANKDESELTSNFVLKIDRNEKMTLTPVNSGASLLTNLITLDGAKENLIYKDIRNFQFDSLKFEKIIFSTTECYGTCPVMAIEIDNNKNFKFIGEKNSIATGHYYGKIPDAEYEKLLDILRLSQLDSIHCGTDRNIDLSTYSLEIHYNDRSRNFKTCMLPFVLDNLKEFLISLPKSLRLNAAAHKFEILVDSELK